jgi:hypothetical protein
VIGNKNAVANSNHRQWRIRPFVKLLSLFKDTIATTTIELVVGCMIHGTACQGK